MSESATIRNHAAFIWSVADLAASPTSGTPLAIVAALGLASKAVSKDPNPKKTLKPQFPETWRSQYPRGSHMNLDGIYEADGVFRLDRGGHTYFLAADNQWHLLETPEPSGAYMQGRYS